MITEIEIGKLQPTDTELNKNTLDYYSKKSNTAQYDQIPEIWDINGELLISNGHNQLYDLHNRFSLETTKVQYYTQENCGVGKEISSSITSTLEEKAKIAKSKGITKITDLKIST